MENKLISKLPKKLREMAIANRDNNLDELSSAFSWGEAPEGGDFWSNVYYGKIPSEYLESDEVNNYEIY